MNRELILIIAQLRRYAQQGSMNRYEIEEVIQLLQKASCNENEQRIHRMMEDITDYMCKSSDNDYLLEEYIRKNLDAVAQLLNRSKRTVYRKIRENCFTLVEKKMIQQYMRDHAEL